MEEVLCEVWEIAMGYFLLGMVEIGRMIAVTQKICVLTDTQKSSHWVPESDRRVLGRQPGMPCIGTGKTKFSGRTHCVVYAHSCFICTEGKAAQCLFKYFFTIEMYICLTWIKVG